MADRMRAGGENSVVRDSQNNQEGKGQFEDKNLSPVLRSQCGGIREQWGSSARRVLEKSRIVEHARHLAANL
ncbi:MAG: hypothetical protein LBJ75_02795, partial [Puniceicoccales bacterium]|nr:hypothetical protein [Puniceicoccales bacterium]